MKQMPMVLIFLLFCGLFLAACEDTPCDGIDCSGHGDCHWTADKTPYCKCHIGYKLGRDITVCERYEDVNNTKPIIYLYPTERTEVTVRFADAADVRLSYTYPLYPEDGWQITAWPDGTLEDPVTGRRYYALYWEGAIDEPEVPGEGFAVAGADTAAFLEEILPRLGLSWAEANEFIVYWLPILGENPYNFIHFLTTTYDAAVPLAVTPAPDTVIRFSMRYRRMERLPEPLPIPQTFDAPARVGFVLVEWGGRVLAEEE